jgi:hypothetical protein
MELFIQVEQAQLEQIQTALVAVVQGLLEMVVTHLELPRALVDLVVAAVAVLLQPLALAAMEFFTFSIRMELL